MSHFFSDFKYNNLLEEISLSSKEIENQVKDYKLAFLPNRNQKAEWGIRFPIFVYAFYDYILTYNRIPKQVEFYNYYTDYNKEFFSTNNYTEEILIGLKARIFRAYPSLVRDICFNKLVRENNPSLDVFYNTKLDVEDGIDLLISYQNFHWGIALYTNTSRAYIGREKKEFRHKTYQDITMIEFPIPFNKCTQHGDFFLYGQNENDNLINIIRNEYRRNQRN